jgi:DnaK suppressor protein
MNEERSRELLKRERERIEAALASLSQEDDDGLSDVDQHPSDQGTDVFEEERDAGIADSMREDLAAVERAEQRLAEGTYGLSVDSGEPIPDERLEAVPWAERTVEEQGRLERGG